MASAASADSAASPVSGAPAAPEPAEIEYDITVRIDPVQRSIQGSSIITVKTKEELTLVLGRRFGVVSARIDADPLGPAASSRNLRAWSIASSKQAPRRIEVQWRIMVWMIKVETIAGERLGVGEVVAVSKFEMISDPR